MKINRLMLAAALMGAAVPMTAQDIYKMETFSGSDLNGTARYVGMGGAMNALGADISTIGVNPAGIAMFRRGDISLSAGFNTQPNALDFYDRGKTHASFDQIGFVFPAQIDDDIRMNFAFNYHKSRNLKSFIGVNGFNTNGLSQSMQMLDLCWLGNRWLDLNHSDDADLTTNLTYAGFQTQMIVPYYDENGNLDGYEPSVADHYNYKRAQWGGIQDYDFNISLSWNDQVYGGLTVGLKNVNFHSFTDYAEMLPDDAGGLHEYFTTNEEAISGTGFDLKLGLILRPIEESPFRIGFAFSTPTFYTLKTDSYLYMNSPYAMFNEQGNQVQDYTDYSISTYDYEYNLNTPWKINLSMGTTIGNVLALDAEYEYSDYGACKISYGGYNAWGEYSWWDSDKDHALNNEAKAFLKGVSTVRVGAEAKLMPGVYARVGYNYQSAPMDKDAYLNLFTDSPSYYYSNNTDYVNLGSINRYTCGLGVKGKHFYADFAYQFQKQSGDLYTFHLPENNSELNRLQAAKVDLNRHQALFTVGYKF